MSILIKNKLSNGDLQKHIFKDIVYDMAYNEVDEKTIYDAMTIEKDTMTIDLNDKKLDMDILYFSRIIKGSMNRFLDKGIKKLVILSKTGISLDFYSHNLSKVVDNHEVVFKDGFIISTNFEVNNYI